MTYRVIVTPEAEADVNRIFAWLEERSRQGALRWYAEWLKVQNSLERNPQLYGLAPENEFVHAEIRQVIFRTRRGLPYRALFWCEEKTIYILHVRGPGQPPILLSQ